MEISGVNKPDPLAQVLMDGSQKMDDLGRKLIKQNAQELIDVSQLDTMGNLVDTQA